MSSLNRGLRLWLKRLEARTGRYGPDHFIFESEAMRETAVRGRGLPEGRTSVIPLGVDPERYAPRPGSDYVRRKFGIPEGRTVVVYSGHMEPRKGVHVIVEAAVELIEHRGRDDIHFVLMGNRNGEEERFDPIYRGTAAEAHVTFGGYRSDIPEIFGSADLACIASTGWDSFTMSSVEMAASGLPLIVSELQGLRETVVPGETGLLFPPGNAEALADRLETVLDDPQLRDRMSEQARERVLRELTTDRQVASMTETIRRVRDGARGA